ncbi:MAG: aminotransferase class I/II-fold pyridoxal phosphate-dependent enzyme [Promethearchaeota archaeon]
MEFKVIDKTPIYETFSNIGKRIYLPQGIFYWSRRAKNEGELIATIGAAQSFESDFKEDGSTQWIPCYLEQIQDYFKSLKINDIVSYAPISGLPELRTIWKEWIIKKAMVKQLLSEKEKDNLSKYITTPIVTNGVTNGIFTCATLFLDPGEFIICPNKRWINYDNIIERMIGGRIKSFNFFKDGNIDLDSLSSTIEEVQRDQKKIIFILNFPNNPTGYIPSKHEASELVKLLREKNEDLSKPFIILVDDAYETYVYEDKSMQRSIFYELHHIDSDVIPIKLDGISKEFLLYGGRIGFITIGLKSSWINDEQELSLLKKELENKISGLLRSTISNCNHFYQALMIKILREKGINNLEDSIDRVKVMLKQRFDLINQQLNSINNEHLSIDPNGGGFFVFLNISPQKASAIDFAEHLLKKYKIGVIPIENPRENINGIRIAYCSVDIKNIPKIVEKIKLALDDF